MKKLISIVFVAITIQSFACLNADGFDIFGKKTYYSWPISFIKKIDIEKYSDKTLKREHDLKTEYKNKAFDEYYYRELSFVKIFQKKYKEAKNLISSGLKIDSIDYSLISNLAVVYELEGNLDSAIILMKKAISIDKYSHHGSEWIHLKILEATKNTRKDKNWIYNNNVLNFKISKDSVPKKRYSNTETGDFVALISSIEYQLQERMLFVKPKNQIVANLLLLIGDLYITEIDYRFANEAYILAKEYDPNLTEICNKRLAYLMNLDPAIKEQERKDSISKIGKLIASQKEYAKKQKEISIQLQKDRAEIAKLRDKSTISVYLIIGGVLSAFILVFFIYKQKKRN